MVDASFFDTLNKKVGKIIDRFHLYLKNVKISSFIGYTIVHRGRAASVMFSFIYCKPGEELSTLGSFTLTTHHLEFLTLETDHDTCAFLELIRDQLAQQGLEIRDNYGEGSA